MYLESCVYTQSCQDQAIHNFLLSLYARYKKNEVMRYISSQGLFLNLIQNFKNDQRKVIFGINSL